MKRAGFVFAGLVAIGLLAGVAESAGAPADSKPFAWQTAAPEAHGFSSAKLDAWRAALAQRNTKTLLLIRNDRIIYEWYAPGFDPDTKHYTASLAKSVVGGLSLALAMSDGLVNADDPAARFVPQWRDDPRKARITLRHLATHSSGIEDAEGDVPHDKLPGWKGAFWRQEPDPFTLSRDQAPLLFDPGSSFAYSNPGMAMLSFALASALRQTKHPNIRELLRERIYAPIGLRDSEWSIGYGKTFAVDGLPLVPNWGGGAFTPRALGRVGRLLLRNGDWEGRRLLDPTALSQTLRYGNTPLPNRIKDPAAPAAGLGWWVNHDGVWNDVPRDAVCGAGAGNQVLMVIPSLQLILVRNGGDLARRGETFWSATEAHLLKPLMAARIETAFQRSDVIRSVRFDPPDKIIRKALGSDNWPITWGDDDHLYTAYGDGWGFEPRIDAKLSQGFARIEGSPGNFRGINLRSPTGERKGEGPAGPKASGMIMVDGILYMWVRNTANATLAWSADRALTWTWGWKFSTTFGSPAFLNFGRNNANARDEFVYTYSQDGPSAYQPADAVILARAPKHRLRDREAWTFFAGRDAAGQPLWSSNLADRAPVLRYPDHCERVDVVYNPGLRRYLMALGFGHGKGWGLFDAPEPWGPWTVAFQTPDWGLGDTHGYRLPSKWISPDGRTLWLLFSGRSHNGTDYDAFCLRKMILE